MFCQGKTSLADQAMMWWIRCYVLREAMGVLLTTAQTPSGQLPYADDVEVNATQLLNVFPYLNTPLTGN
jgi:hypothetical protein